MAGPAFASMTFPGRRIVAHDTRLAREFRLNRMKTQIHPGLAPVADRYDGFVVDLWGTLHDGVEPLPGARDCLLQLRETEKGVVLLWFEELTGTGGTASAGTVSKITIFLLTARRTITILSLI